jgi:hypothetical protein
MLCNLFDSNFGSWPISTACQTSQHIQYVKRQMDFDGVTIFTDEWINNPIVDEVKSRYKVGWLHEPYCLHPETYRNALRNLNKFDLMLSYWNGILDYGDNTRLCIYGGTWIDRRDWGIKPKSKLCSMLIGSKLSTDGHRIRHEIADMIEANGYPVDFYGTRGEPVDYGQDTKLKVLGDYCFSIVTETCREDNLFTEWLLDCFAVGTVPIFWGAPNIHEFFDSVGIAQFDTVDRCQKILSRLSMGDWMKQLSGAYLNLIKMQQYAVTEDWLYVNVLKELE